MNCRRFLFALLLLLPGLRAGGQDLALDRAQSSLTFVGQAFLHSFRGEAREMSGSARFTPGAAVPVQKATLHFPIRALTTFQATRDAKMLEWLEAGAQPEAVFALESVRLLEGKPTQASAAQPARFAVEGALTLHGSRRPVSGTARGWREKDRLVVAGEVTLDTQTFGLPRIRTLMMTVDPKVRVSYRLSFILPADLRGQ